MEGTRGPLALFILAACFLVNGAQKTVCTEEAVADIVFLVDGSWSIGTENFEQIRQFLSTLVDSFEVGADHVRIGLVQYSNNPETEFLLNSFQTKQDVLQYISRLPYRGGGTKTGLGLDFMLKNHFTDQAGSRANEGVPQIAVVITDGQSQDNVEPHAQDLKRRGITLYAIGIKDADEIQLREIASDPLDQHVYSVSDFAALQGISQSIVQVLCTTVEEAKRQVTVVADECRTVADIVFLVDGSSSIGTQNFQEVRAFLHNFIGRLEIGEQNVRVGLIQYSDEPHQEFLLADHMDKKSLIEKVDNLPYRTGGTYTGKAMKFLQKHYFNKASGRLTDERVPQIAVVITDGDSADDVVAPAQLLRQQGVIVFAIGVGQANNVELEAIANRPHERFLVNINNYQDLQGLSRPDSLLQTVCVSMTDQRQALAATFADIFFLLDSSMTPADYQQVRSLLMRLGTQMTLGAEANRFGLAQFGQTVKVEFLLNAHPTKEETIIALRRFRLRANGSRNLGSALEVASKQFFNAAAGGRADQGSRQYLVVVTGGDSKDEAIRASRLVKAEGVTVVAVGLGTATLMQLRTVATAPYMYQSTNIVLALKNVFETEEEVITLSGDCKSAKVADIVFIVDESGSIGTANFNLIRTFLRDIVDGLEVGLNEVRVGIVLYSDRATAQIYLNSFSDKKEILQFIKILPYRGGGTSTGAALRFAKENIFIKERGSRSGQNIEQVAVVITDGESQDNVSAPAAELRRSGVKIYAVGIKNANEAELRQIASYPHQKHVFIADGFTKLKSMKQILQKNMCYNIIRSAATDTTQTDTIKKGCEETEEADIYFLIDHSGSIQHHDFIDMKKFIVEFLQSFHIGPQHVRVGVAKYADTPELEFDLTAYTDSKSLEKAVERINQLGGGTKTGLALDSMGPYFEQAEVSRRDKVPQYLFVITDGKSYDEVMQPALKLRNQGITIYSIGVKNADQTELVQISGSPEKKFFVDDFDALTLIKDKVITDICSPEACKDAKGDLLFLIDSSGSISTDDFQKMKEFMKSVVKKSAIGQDKVHVGIMQFSVIQRMEFPLNQFYDIASMEAAIDAMRQIGGGTHTGKAIAEISEYFDPARGGRTNMKRYLIVVTDGEAQDEVKQPAEALRNRGVLIYAIGVANANSTQLLEISGSQKRLHSVRDFDSLASLENELALAICDPEEECIKTDIADIIFLVDGSTSITLDDFRSMKTFMVSVVNKTTVAEKQTRFGVILFSTDVQPQFNLNTYFTKREIRSAILDLKSPYGDTYTAKALNQTIEYFDAKHGGRRASNVPQVLMVITDGEATDARSLPGPSLKLKENKISVFAIGVKGADVKELEIMTSGDKSKVFFVDKVKDLETLQTNMSTVLCKSVIKVCEKQRADLVMLIDDSASIYEANFTIMTEFMADLASNFTIGQEYVHVGAAQFSTDLKDVFYLNQFFSEAEVRKQIMSIKQRNGEETNIGAALKSIRKYFLEENGCRAKSGVLQNLVLITDGDSSDSVLAEAIALRSMNISVFVIGIGKMNLLELQQLAGSKNRVFTVDKFISLEKIMFKVLREICKTEPSPPGCSIDIGIGFDNTGSTGSHLLLDRQPKLQAYLPEIVRYMSTLDGLCCGTPGPVKAHIGFRVVSQGGVDDWNFEEYSEDIVKKVMALQITGPTYFNAALLNSFKEKFQKSNAGVKVLVIFSDGLDEEKQIMEKASELLRLNGNGIHALLIVALEGVQNAHSFQTVEFGRGFGYKQPLSIGMQSVGYTMRKQIDTVAERECCNVACKCTGQEGTRGLSGNTGPKGQPGLKGHPGFPGEEGGIGERGPPGTTGPHGLQGCPGIRGQKGFRGYRGNRGDDGEHGLDGVNGEQGVTGLAGGPGERGDPGDPGSSGLKGEQGVKGQPGLRGDPGETGQVNKERGPPGQRGHAGLPGDAGEDGKPGENGLDGNKGQQGRRGPPGPKGPNGDAGAAGPPGVQGLAGPVGAIGDRGDPGPRGSVGLPGPQGPPGAAGGKGSVGRQGPYGRKGEPGEPGVKGVTGPLGPRGIPGLDGRDGYGAPGPKGLKGEPGFPGYPGKQGENGRMGVKGGPGPKGNHGRGGNAGDAGPPGDSGETGKPGYRGPRGAPGSRTKSDCELITYIRDNCACSQARAECPSYPTELVFALDMSENVRDADIKVMRSTLVSLLNGISIAESNCPTGARVAVVAYSNYTKYLIRFQDYQNKAKLIEAVENIASPISGGPLHLGAAMRYVGHNVFKRVRQGKLMRKVAIFLSSGPAVDAPVIVTAAMEYKALGITPAVISLRDNPDVQNAFEVDDTGSFMLTVLSPETDRDTQLKRVKQCVMCYDPCAPAAECSITMDVLPQRVDMDLTLLVDGSRGVQADQYAGVQSLLGRVVEQLAVSPKPGQGDRQARVALVQPTGSQDPAQQPARLEFGLQRYQNHSVMKRHILRGMRQQGGACALGQALDWTLQEVLLKVPRPRHSKVVLVVVGDEVVDWDHAKLHYVSQQAKCKGVVLFVITVGEAYNRTQVEELASTPMEQHLLHLGQMREEEQGYAQRFFRALLAILNREERAYPPPSLKHTCEQLVKLSQSQEHRQVYMYNTSVPEQWDEDLEDLSGQQQVFLEHTGVYQSKPGGRHQVDVPHTLSSGDGDLPRRVGERRTSRPNTRDPTSLLRKEAAKAVDKSVCSLKQDVGSCQTYTVMWFFDATQRECSRFWFGGCGGNGNRFKTQEECETLCLTRKR